MSAHHQHREHGDVTELVGDTAAQDIGEPAMSVRRHRDEVAPLALSAGCDFLGGITTGQNCLSLVAVLLERLGNRLDVLAVALHLFGFAKIELVDVSGRPPVGNMDQHDRRTAAARPRQFTDVIEDHFVVL